MGSGAWSCSAPARGTISIRQRATLTSWRYENSGRPGISQSYFNARHEFEQLFERKVDLLTLDALTNPFLIDAVDRDRVVLCETVDGVVMAKEPRMYLHDAAMALAAISRYLTGKSFDDYQRDDLLQAAVERRFEIAAEALNQLSKIPPSITSRIPDLAVVVGFRNVLARDYAAVNNRIVWDLVQTRAPALLEEIEKLLKELSSTTDPGKRQQKLSSNTGVVRWEPRCPYNFRGVVCYNVLHERRHDNRPARRRSRADPRRRMPEFRTDPQRGDA
jgi:uncharacterized protein with HEPN domain